MHAANTVPYNMANDDESFNQEMTAFSNMSYHLQTRMLNCLLADRVMEFCGLYCCVIRISHPSLTFIFLAARMMSRNCKALAVKQTAPGK